VGILRTKNSYKTKAIRKIRKNMIGEKNGQSNKINSDQISVDRLPSTKIGYQQQSKCD
jgi:hypothetical protein